MPPATSNATTTTRAIPGTANPMNNRPMRRNDGCGALGAGAAVADISGGGADVCVGRAVTGAAVGDA